MNFFCVIFFLKNMHFYLKTAFVRVFFLQKLQRQKSVANAQDINVNTLRPKKYLHLSGIVDVCDCNSIRQAIDFYRKYRNFRSIFHGKTAEKNDLSEIMEAILVKTLGKYYLQLSSVVKFFECNVNQKISDFYLKNSIF